MVSLLQTFQRKQYTFKLIFFNMIWALLTVLKPYL